MGQAHPLFWQTKLPPQMTPQKPQLFLFDVTSTQVLPQGLKPEAQVITQMPPEQWGAVAGQRVPHVPQLVSLVWVFTQALPQVE